MLANHSGNRLNQMTTILAPNIEFFMFKYTYKCGNLSREQGIWIFVVTSKWE